MRRAIIKHTGPIEAELPIQYSLVQRDGSVALEATVGTLIQTLLILYPHSIRKVRSVSDRIGLPTSGNIGSIIIEECH